MASVFSNFAGTQNGSFFRILPEFVNRSSKPGSSVLPKPTFLDVSSGSACVSYPCNIVLLVFAVADSYSLCAVEHGVLRA
jgi:hypothetical protein